MWFFRKKHKQEINQTIPEPPLSNEALDIVWNEEEFMLYPN